MSINQTVVKARRTGTSVALTCPFAEEGRAYLVSRTNTGVIVYHPIRTVDEMRQSNAERKNMTLGEFTQNNPGNYHPNYDRGEE